MSAQVAEAVLPRVSGRHRDRALASARKCRAIQLKLQGLTYQQIADELGYTSRGTVYKIVKTAQAAQLRVGPIPPARVRPPGYWPSVFLPTGTAITTGWSTSMGPTLLAPPGLPIVVVSVKKSTFAR